MVLYVKKLIAAIFLMGCKMYDHINLILHHTGRFKRDDHGTLEYVDDEFYVWENCEVNLMIVDYF